MGPQASPVWGLCPPPGPLFSRAESGAARAEGACRDAALRGAAFWPCSAPMSGPLYACLHLPPSPFCDQFVPREEAMRAIRTDLDELVGLGFDGILLENDNDKPHRLAALRTQLPWITVLAAEARRRVRVPLGINVQRIDWEGALAIAAAVGLEMVRLDVFVDRVEMQGELVEVDARAVMGLRRELCRNVVQVWADVEVKHAERADEQTLETSVARAIDEGASAILVTGQRTGEPPSITDLQIARRVARGRAPVLIASGLTKNNAAELRMYADGAIVGTALKVGDRIGGGRAAEIVHAWRR